MDECCLQAGQRLTIFMCYESVKNTKFIVTRWVLSAGEGRHMHIPLPSPTPSPLGKGIPSLDLRSRTRTYKVQGQGLSSRTTTLGYNEKWLTYCDISVSNNLASVIKTFFTVTSCMVAITTFMDFTWSYITDYLQNEKSLTIFEDFVVQGQRLEVRAQDKDKDL